MGQIEHRSRKRKSKKDIQKAILTSVQVAGLLSIALVAPNAIQCLQKLGIAPGKRQKEIMKRSRDRLVENKLLKYEHGYFKLTSKGETELEKLEREDWKIHRPHKWDGRWRVLIFDIPERKRSSRDKIRTTLAQIGFVKLQNSVWIYPYDCEDIISLLKADFHIGKDLLYLIVDSLENDKGLRKLFKLPLE